MTTGCSGLSVACVGLSFPILRAWKLFSPAPPAFIAAARKALMMGEAEEGQPSAN